MKPTQEQLNDPKWWDDNVDPEYDYAFTTGRKWKGDECVIGAVKFGDKLGNTSTGGLAIGEWAWMTLAKRPTKPAFVPNTETKTIYWVAEVDSYGTPWNFDGPHDDYESAEDSIPLLLAVGDKNRKLVATSMEFRPIKSERELFVEQLAKLGKGYGSLYSEEFAGEVYDSGLFCLKETDK